MFIWGFLDELGFIEFFLFWLLLRSLVKRLLIVLYFFKEKWSCKDGKLLCICWKKIKKLKKNNEKRIKMSFKII